VVNINYLLEKIKKNHLLSIILFRNYVLFKKKLWVLKDSRSIRNEKNKSLFVDLGANIGQSYLWFSKHFKKNIKFELFEPNPNCFKKLKYLSDIKKNFSIINFGVGAEAGIFKFYGSLESDGNNFQQSGSNAKDYVQNVPFYKNSNSKVIDVKIINFSNYLTKQSKKFDKIFVKMDIEGSEVDLLESLIKNNTINFIDVLYIEFHSQYMHGALAQITKSREKKIIKYIKSNTNIGLRLWD
jgi:FkbM family methyltransferase